MRSTALLPVILAIAISSNAYSQKQKFEAEDGTTVDVEVISTDPDGVKKASIYVGMFGPEGVNLAGASYYNPGSFYLNAMIGVQGGIVDGSIFFISKLTEATDKQSVKVKGNSRYLTKYVAEIPGTRRKSFGIHAGTSYIDYSKFTNDNYSFHTANGIIAGLSYLKSSFTHWGIDDKSESQGTLLFRLNADVIYYLNRKFVNKDINADAINDVSRNIGFRLYCDGKTSVWSRKGRTSVQYMLGVGRNSSTRSKVGLLAGLGLGFNFL